MTSPTYPMVVRALNCPWGTSLSIGVTVRTCLMTAPSPQATRRCTLAGRGAGTAPQHAPSVVDLWIKTEMASGQLLVPEGGLTHDPGQEPLVTPPAPVLWSKDAAPFVDHSPQWLPDVPRDKVRALRRTHEPGDRHPAVSIAVHGQGLRAQHLRQAGCPQPHAGSASSGT